MKTKEIMVVEDNDTMRLGIAESLKRQQYTVIEFDNGADALNYFERHQTSMAILDLKMEPIDGIELLKKLKSINPAVEVLMISAYGTVESAVEAMKLGAVDFLTKPFSPEELRIKVNKVFEKIKSEKLIEDLIEQNKILNDELFTGYEEMVGSSIVMKEVFNLIEQVADKESSVLIQGESGTGKELIARAIHKRSRRNNCPFIKINCGALNDNLLESELFGHEKGSFTGAIRNKKGRFELADKGTLFLDEIGDISNSMQVKLLRVLQEGEFERVGGELTIQTDVRILAATNKDLRKLISEEKFREDLFYRLSVIPIQLPSLRERRDDIILLVDHFLKKVSAKNRSSEKRIDKEGMQLLINYSFPGNIRELENLIERLFVICTSDKIEPELISNHLSTGNSTAGDFNSLPLDDALYSFEKNMIMQAMKKSDGVKNRAAKLLGINTSALYYKLDKFKLL
jgi:DNA-binding NtrC family response regulator